MEKIIITELNPQKESKKKIINIFTFVFFFFCGTYRVRERQPAGQSQGSHGLLPNPLHLCVLVHNIFTFLMNHNILHLCNGMAALDLPILIK